MKLKNKLLPIFGIAIPTAIVTPLVSACNSPNNATDNWLWDPAIGYSPALQPRNLEIIDGHSYDTLNNQVINYWVNDMKNNKNVFYDDFAYYKLNPSTVTSYELFKGFIPTKISLKITDVNNVEAESQWSRGDKVNNALISLNAHVEGFATSFDGDLQIYTDMDMEIKNIPYVIHQSTMFNQCVFFAINERGIGELNNISMHIVIEQNGIVRDNLYDKDHQIENIVFPLITPGVEIITPLNLIRAIFNQTKPDGSLTKSYHFMFSYIDID